MAQPGKQFATHPFKRDAKPKRINNHEFMQGFEEYATEPETDEATNLIQVAKCNSQILSHTEPFTLFAFVFATGPPRRGLWYASGLPRSVLSTSCPALFAGFACNHSVAASWRKQASLTAVSIASKRKSMEFLKFGLASKKVMRSSRGTRDTSVPPSP